jgi:REP element-mobilizing transposase RayT
VSRGDRREAIFYDDADRVEFLRTLGQACIKTGWQVHAYCLMSNHFHLVLETPQPSLVTGMKGKPERGQSLLLTVGIVLCEGGVIPRLLRSNMLGRATT